MWGKTIKKKHLTSKTFTCAFVLQVYIRRSYQAYELTTLYHEKVCIYILDAILNPSETIAS